jgi:hypothetical protein
MGLIHIELFATLDLVGQAPGGPDEDPVGFPFGGWQAPLMDEVAGSLNLVQTLLREKLFDRLDSGCTRRVFDGGAVPTNVTLLEPPAVSPKGTVYLRYGLADGAPGTGDMSARDRGVGRDD